MSIQTTVFCSLQVEGIHSWPKCPHEEVSYLRDPHRHIFHIKAYKKVNHDDRDVEFIMMQHSIQKYLLEKYQCGPRVGNFGFNAFMFGSMSCEMIGLELLKALDLCKVEVNEDDENGAIVEVIND